MAQKKSVKRNANKKSTRKKTTKKNAKKRAAKKPLIELNDNQTKTLKGLTTTFQHNGSHRMTQQSLIDKGLAITDKTGTKIKSTALGRRHAKKL